MGWAHMILHWQENLVEKEMPPRWMWSLDEELNRHFEKIKAQRAGDIEDDEDSAAGGMLVNEYAQERRRAAK